MLDRSSLYAADTENHQVRVVELDAGVVETVAGNGQEARRNRGVGDAAFAQPSGLALADGTLYVADAESNIVRPVALPPVNEVTTLAGGDLFEFGDVDDTGGGLELPARLKR